MHNSPRVEMVEIVRGNADARELEDVCRIADNDYLHSAGVRGTCSVVDRRD